MNLARFVADGAEGCAEYKWCTPVGAKLPCCRTQQGYCRAVGQHGMLETNLSVLRVVMTYRDSVASALFFVWLPRLFCLFDQAGGGAREHVTLHSAETFHAVQGTGCRFFSVLVCEVASL